MKNFIINNRAIVAEKRIIMIIMAVVLLALPTMAQQQEWQSTSTMQTSGSAYSSQVTEVGATVVESQATTTANYAPGRPGQLRRDIGTNKDGGHTNDDSSPVGDAMVPLLLMSVVFGGVIAVRRKRNAISK